mgnify:CR=1 FL=1
MRKNSKMLLSYVCKMHKILFYFSYFIQNLFAENSVK